MSEQPSPAGGSAADLVRILEGLLALQSRVTLTGGPTIIVGPQGVEYPAAAPAPSNHTPAPDPASTSHKQAVSDRRADAIRLGNALLPEARQHEVNWEPVFDFLTTWRGSHGALALARARELAALASGRAVASNAAGPRPPGDKFPKAPRGLDVSGWPNATEAAKQKHVDPATILRAAGRGELVAYQRGKKEVAIDPASLLKWRRSAKKVGTGRKAENANRALPSARTWACTSCQGEVVSIKQPRLCGKCNRRSVFEQVMAPR